MATTSIENVSRTMNSSYVLIIFPLPQDSERVVPPYQLPRHEHHKTVARQMCSIGYIKDCFDNKTNLNAL